jgi:hypothetical protein
VLRTAASIVRVSCATRRIFSVESINLARGGRASIPARTYCAMSATQQRERAAQTAKSDFPTALQRARGISDAWCRAQALAWVARFAPDGDVERVAAEALKAAAAANDPYQHLGGASWTIRALAERGRIAKAAAATSTLVILSSDISHPVSRLHALWLLVQAAWTLDRKARSEVLRSLVAACHAAESWRAGRTLRDLVLTLAPEEPDEARHIQEQMPEGRYRRQARTRLEAGQTLTPRIYYW